ncbi:uncharacterized protein LOC141803392 [Halichoeres trimaculatus]|uniref:uncharacterized protein LOC141803392 n=1 Tax=Halichoeres trimaculatus TaxID=147232 RepID=UPI003D9E0AAE
MSVDANLKIEIVSLLLGESFQPSVKKRYGKEATLSVEEFHLRNLTGRRRTSVQAAFINEKEFFDPQYDHDFSNLSDSSRCMRGDEEYERPKGWYRIALKVKGKYPDGDDWLGTDGWRSHSVPGEWPVSYHGTTLKGAKGIIGSHYTAGERAMYGRGIYSTPDLSIAERYYAQVFTSETTGKRYKVILQNRINPREREICSFRDYWLIPVPKGTSAEEEKDIVESSIRPYGILIKELIDTDDDLCLDEGRRNQRKTRNATSNTMTNMRVMIEVVRLMMFGTIKTIKGIITAIIAMIRLVGMMLGLVESFTTTTVRTTKAAWEIIATVLLILMIVMKLLMKVVTVMKALVTILLIKMVQAMKAGWRKSAPALVKLMDGIRQRQY